jgi:tetratricopeptide (TPR) repeat protein
MFRRDWIMRLIEQVAEFVRKCAGLVDKGSYDEALDVAARAWSELLDVPRELVDRVDAPTLAELLQTAAKQRCAARLLVVEARAYEGKGDPLHAALSYRRAFELYLEARAQNDEDADDPEDASAIYELSRRVPPGDIHPRYRL